MNILGLNRHGAKGINIINTRSALESTSIPLLFHLFPVFNPRKRFHMNFFFFSSYILLVFGFPFFNRNRFLPACSSRFFTTSSIAESHGREKHREKKKKNSGRAQTQWNTFFLKQGSKEEKKVKKGRKNADRIAPVQLFADR